MSLISSCNRVGRMKMKLPIISLLPRQFSFLTPLDFSERHISTFLHDPSMSTCDCLACFNTKPLRNLQIRRNFSEKPKYETDLSPLPTNAPSPSTQTSSPQIDVNTLTIDDLLVRNKSWVKSVKDTDPLFFQRLGQGQTPKFLYFGCSDSRVPANEILGLGPGEVFVHRNVGNLVPGNDLNSLAVLEYAVEHLQVTDIIVTGHYDCGAIKAATSRQDLGTLENWLRLIRDVYRLHRDSLDFIEDEKEFHKRLVELNVIEQCINVYKAGVVQRRRLKSKQTDGTHSPRIHGLVFDPSEGILRKLPVNFAARVGSLEHIYRLY